jgi:hypothetical protein
MELTEQELRQSNAKSLALYKCLVEGGNYGTSLGITVSMPTMMPGTQLTHPCLPDKKSLRRTNAMQKRTGCYSISMAKETTKYDHLLDKDYQDHTEYKEFRAPANDDVGEVVDTEEVITAGQVSNTDVTKTEAVDVDKATKSPLFSVGVLDL